jgi:hypothetical protein
MTFSIKTFSIMTFSKMTLKLIPSVIILSANYAEGHNYVHYAECRGTCQRHCYFEKQLGHLNNFRSLGTM